MAQSPIQIIPNLVQGVSQQAAQNRRDAQAETQFDCVNSVLEGVAARPHGDLIKLWPNRVLTDALFSETSHGIDENYLTGITAAGIPFAIDLADGTDCTLTNLAPDYSYLTAGSMVSRKKLRAQVVDDFTFIGNRQKTIGLLSAVSPTKRNEVIVFIRATTFGGEYRVSLSGPGAVTAQVTTSGSNVAATTKIARGLREGYTENDVTGFTGSPLNGTAGYTCDQYGSTLHIYRADGQAFTVVTTDGNGDDYMRAFKGECPSYDKLPSKAPTGVILKIRGEDRSGDDDYYVKFVGDPSTGNWQETVAPATATSLDASSMPHALVCTGYRTFEFRRLTWSTRIAGDVDTAKDPGFVGKQVMDMIYHQRRFGVIWSAGAVFSKTNNPFTFFPDTVQTILATAPVDVKVSSGDKRGASVLDFGLQAQENLYLWAQKSQFRVSSGQEAFKQDTVEVLPSMSYQYAADAYPLSVGSFVFLAQDVGTFASLRALLFTQTKLSGDVDVTSHVGQYIAGGVNGLTASEALRYLFVQSAGNDEVLYLFNYTYDAQEGFIQTAINTWRIPGGKVLWCSLKDNALRVFQQRPEGVAYLSFDLTPGKKDPVAGARYNTRLDLRLDESRVSSLTYDAASNQTTFVLPYKPTGPDILVVTRADKAGGYTRGRQFPVISVSNYTVTVTGDLRGYAFYVGHRIRAERQDSEFFVRSDKGAVPTDRLTANRYFLTLAESAYTRIEVDTPNKPTKQYEFTGQQLGGSGAQTGTPVPQNGMLQAPIGEETKNVTITLINDSFLPSYWQSAAYDYAAVGWGGMR